MTVAVTARQAQEAESVQCFLTSINLNHWVVVLRNWHVFPPWHHRRHAHYRIRQQLFKGELHVLGGLAIQEAWKIVVLNWIAWKWSWRFLVWKTYASSAEPKPKLWSVLGWISSCIQTSSFTLRPFSFGGKDEKGVGIGQGRRDGR